MILKSKISIFLNIKRKEYRIRQMQALKGYSIGWFCANDVDPIQTVFHFIFGVLLGVAHNRSNFFGLFLQKQSRE